MRAFAVNFRCYLVEEDQAGAQAKVDVLRSTCKSRGFEPGAGVVREVSGKELSAIPALMREVERRTRPMFGPAATDADREAALRALTAASHGEAGAASAALHAVERSCGYLPRRMAQAMAATPAPPTTQAGAA